jgi:hypothetical protein
VAAFAARHPRCGGRADRDGAVTEISDLIFSSTNAEYLD